MIKHQHLKDKNDNNQLSDQEWEAIASDLIQKKFDQEKSASFAQKLAAKGIHREEPEQKQLKFSIFKSKWIYLAASMVLLLGAVWFMRQNGGMPQDQQLATAYLEQPFRLDEGGTRGSVTTSDSRSKAIEAYQNKDYSKAIEYLSAIEASGESTAADYFQKGLSHLYQKKPNYAESIKAFQNGSAKDPAVYKDEIEWFTALAYVLNGDKISAKPLLEKIIQSPTNRQKEKAKELLNKL